MIAFNRVSVYVRTYNTLILQCLAILQFLAINKILEGEFSLFMFKTILKSYFFSFLQFKIFKLFLNFS